MKKTLFILSAFLCAAAAASPACSTEESRPGSSSGSFALTGGEAGCRTLNPSGPFMTSPSWLPDGSGVVARGYMGRGIYLVKCTARKPAAILQDFTGLVEWTARREGFCLRGGGSAEAYVYDAASGTFRRTERARSVCDPGPGDFSTRRVLFEDSGMEIAHDPYCGSIELRQGGETAMIEERGAWGVKVSPEGGKIAYSKGSLRGAALVVYEVGKGPAVVGKGAHPSWFPDGRFLAYDRGQWSAAGEGSGITGADLFILDMEEKKSRRLTDTPEAAEMQPSVSPDGSRIACSDWKSGAIIVIDAPEEAGP